MIEGKKVVVVMPAYNAEKTLKMTYQEIPEDIVDEVVLTDDFSRDGTVELGRTMGIRHIVVHDKNRGYGGNQKTSYEKALSLEAEIVIMLHPDDQYTPKLITAMASLIANDVYPVELGSRILGRGALLGGMPVYKYVANRFLTLFQNILLNQKLSEYHTGYRAFSARVLMDLDLTHNSDDFIFDNQILAQILYKGYEIGEVTCPTRYFDEASSINFRRSMRYGLGVVITSVQYRLNKWGLLRSKLFHPR